MNKTVWVVFSISFLIYGIYDLYQGIVEIRKMELKTLQYISKLIVPLYIIGCSLYILYLKVIKKVHNNVYEK